MKTYIQLLTLSTSLLFSLNIQAEEQQQEKNFSIGLGAYALVLSYDDSTIDDDDFEESERIGVYIADASPTITGFVIRNNGSDGIYLTNSYATIENNTIK